MKVFSSKNIDEQAAIAKEWLEGIVSFRHLDEMTESPSVLTENPSLGKSGQKDSSSRATTNVVNKNTVTGAVVVGLSGHLGAGKTAFVKAVAKELGIEEEVTSPTFVIMKIYETKNETFKKLVHIDAYRLERREELEALKFENIVSDPGNLVMIEWPENVGLAKTDLDEFLKFDIVEGDYVISIKKVPPVA